MSCHQRSNTLEIEIMTKLQVLYKGGHKISPSCSPSKADRKKSLNLTAELTSPDLLELSLFETS